MAYELYIWDLDNGEKPEEANVLLRNPPDDFELEFEAKKFAERRHSQESFDSCTVRVQHNENIVDFAIEPVPTYYFVASKL